MVSSASILNLLLAMLVLGFWLWNMLETLRLLNWNPSKYSSRGSCDLEPVAPQIVAQFDGKYSSCKHKACNRAILSYCIVEMTIGMQFLYIPLLSVFLSFQFSDIEKCVKVFPGIVQDRVFSGEWGFGIENLIAGFGLYQSQYLSFFQSQQFSGIKVVLQFS